VISLDDAIETAATGDIWLFRGHSFADRAIQTLTNSPVNHVGMVVALDDLPPLLWHAELGRSLPDVWTGRRQRGVQLHRLRDAVTTWEQRYGQRAWLRQLQGGEVERHHEDRLMEVIDRFDGHPFPTTARLAGRWAAGRFRRRETSLVTPGVPTPARAPRGGFGGWRRREAGPQAVYCAELVATTYQAMGLLSDRHPASWYDPGRFWSGDHVALVPPFRLGDEIAVSPTRHF
jgi:hypothetical protein